MSKSHLSGQGGQNNDRNDIPCKKGKEMENQQQTAERRVSMQGKRQLLLPDRRIAKPQCKIESAEEEM